MVLVLSHQCEHVTRPREEDLLETGDWKHFAISSHKDNSIIVVSKRKCKQMNTAEIVKARCQLFLKADRLTGWQADDKYCSVFKLLYCQTKFFRTAASDIFASHS